MRQKKRERERERDTGRRREAISGCAYLDVCLLVEQALGYCGGGERHTLNQVQRRHGDAHPQDTHTHTHTHSAASALSEKPTTPTASQTADSGHCVSFSHKTSRRHENKNRGGGQ